MNLSSMKLAAVNALMRWIAGELWALAQDAVYLLAERDDLAGAEKLAMARQMLLDRVAELGKSLKVSAANFLLEAAVQVVKARVGQ
ncbi:MAG: hypothetical protein MUC53_00270 [Candidatus Contendobacter sp.]|jgi:hypothetical protein|nr:hypothetical protein [Candidatus Contendobacter sp.]